MSVTSNEREARQLALMHVRLGQFRAGQIDIARAIVDLEGLLNALEHAPDDWRDEFIEEWSVMEIASAVALDRQTPLPRASDADIADAVAQLEWLVAERTGLIQ